MKLRLTYLLSPAFTDSAFRYGFMMITPTIPIMEMPVLDPTKSHLRVVFGVHPYTLSSPGLVCSRSFQGLYSIANKGGFQSPSFDRI